MKLGDKSSHWLKGIGVGFIRSQVVRMELAFCFFFPLRDNFLSLYQPIIVCKCSSSEEI